MDSTHNVDKMSPVVWRRFSNFQFDESRLTPGKDLAHGSPRRRPGGGHRRHHARRQRSDCDGPTAADLSYARSCRHLLAIVQGARGGVARRRRARKHDAGQAAATDGTVLGGSAPMVTSRRRRIPPMQDHACVSWPLTMQRSDGNVPAAADPSYARSCMRLLAIDPLSRAPGAVQACSSCRRSDSSPNGQREPLFSLRIMPVPIITSGY
jgi:hypothetical protein